MRYEGTSTGLGVEAVRLAQESKFVFECMRGRKADKRNPSCEHHRLLSHFSTCRKIASVSSSALARV